MDTNPMPTQLPWLGERSPHGTIEVNQSCNISCRGCYKEKFSHDKSLETIRHEVDTLMALRRVGSITLAGGEPTLHPALEEVVSYIASRGVRPLLLTNGTLLTRERLVALRKAGLERVLLHIDSGQQQRPDQEVYEVEESAITALRDRYIREGSAVGLDMSPAVTLYRDRLEGFSGVIEYCFASPHVNSMLVTNYVQSLNHGELVEDNRSLDNRLVMATLQRKMGLLPAWYIPSTDNQKELRWLFYLTVIVGDGSVEGDRFHVSPRHPVGLRLLPQLSRLKYGRFAFDDPFSRFDVLVFLAIYGLFSGSLGTLARSFRFFLRAMVSRDVRVVRLCFQQGPNKKPDGSYEACLDCPDATIRNGKLVNLCLVDKICPHDRAGVGVDSANATLLDTDVTADGR
jgi:hypothetical protein